MSYSTNQNLIVRYACGGGGKFLISSLFLFDNVAHWNEQVQQGTEHNANWVNTVWPTHVSEWSKFEPQQPWNLNFFSRRFDRNNHLTTEQYDKLVQEYASKYFFQCWNQGLLIVDHYHKRQRLAFQTNSRIIDIGLSSQSLEVYKTLVKHKLWLWHDPTKTIISTLDHPDYSHSETSRFHREQFNNNYIMSGYKDYDDFFENWLLQQYFVKPFVDQPVVDADITLDLLDLVDLDRYIGTIEKLEKYFNQTVNHDTCVFMHHTWSERSQLSMCLTR